MYVRPSPSLAVVSDSCHPIANVPRFYAFTRRAYEHDQSTISTTLRRNTLMALLCGYANGDLI